MTAFSRYLWLQLKMDLRDKGTLLNYYLVPLLFFFVVGAVFASINPTMKATLSATMTIFAVTMGAVMGFPTPIVKLRESGTMRALKVNGIPNSAVLAVHALSAFIHLLIVSVIIYVAAPIAFKSNLPDRPAIYLAVLASLLFTSISVGLLLGVASKSHSFATMFSMIVFLPSLLLSGIMFPSTMLPRALEWVGRIFPATYVLQAFYGLAYHVPTALSGGWSLAVVLGMGLALFAVSLWKFGQRAWQ